MNLDGINHTAACAIERIADAEIKRLEAEYNAHKEAAARDGSALGEPYFVEQRQATMAAIKSLRLLSAEAARIKWQIIASEEQ